MGDLALALSHHWVTGCGGSPSASASWLPCLRHSNDFCFGWPEKLWLTKTWGGPWVLFFCTQSPAKTHSLLVFLFAGWQECLAPLLNKLISFEEGTAFSWLVRIARQHTLSCHCLNILGCFDVLSSLNILLIRSRIRVSFTDYSSVARSTCMGKERIIKTDLCELALSDYWASLLRFKIWSCVYQVISTSPGFCSSNANSRLHVLWKTVELFLQVPFSVRFCFLKVLLWY